MATKPASQSCSTAAVRSASGRYVVNHYLTDPEVAGTLAEYRARLKKQPELRVALLKKAGILTASGKTSKKFGG
jgi:hypothetical protein